MSEVLLHRCLSRFFRTERLNQTLAPFLDQVRDSASERRGNHVKYFKDFYLKAKV